MLTHLEVEGVYDFQVFKHDVHSIIWQDPVTTCPSATCVMVIYI